MNRRKFLNIGFGLIPFVGFSGALANIQTPSRTTNYELTFSKFIDTLLPEDITPSGSQLSIDSSILNYAETVKNYTKLIELGCYWLDLKSKSMFDSEFFQLREDESIRVVLELEQSPIGNIENQFFQRILNDAFRFYYSKPESWSQLSINTPPQPLGYPQYSENTVS